jgi:hypothetical protein
VLVSGEYCPVMMPHSPPEECAKCVPVLNKSSAQDYCVAHVPGDGGPVVRAVHFELRFEDDNTTYNVCVTESSPSTGSDVVCAGLNTEGWCGAIGGRLRHVYLHCKGYMGDWYYFDVVRAVYVGMGDVWTEQTLPCKVRRVVTN